MISITCTSCTKVLEIDDAFAGGVCRCQFCGTIQTVPKPKLAKSGASPAASKTLYQRKVPLPGQSGTGLENLVDAARARKFAKRAGGGVRVAFDEAILPLASRDPDVVALDDALTALEDMDPRKSRVVELRFFAGLSVEETAAVLGVSTDTVSRDWKFAKTWLYRELRDARRLAH